MKEICITCCWEGLVHAAWLMIKLAFWPAVVYAGVYALGAVAFLANLRAKVGPSGRLEVAHDSWEYMLARPMRYGRIKAAKDTWGFLTPAKQHELPDSWFRPTGICSLYARLLNMLLFVWPFLLVYLVGGSLLGTVLFGLVFGVGYVTPDFAKEGWLKRTLVRNPDDWPANWTVVLRVPLMYYVAVFTLFMIAFHFTAFLQGVWMAFLGVLCLLPLIGLITGVVYGSRKIVREKDDETTSVGLAAEFLAAKKEGWCKMVEVK